MLKIKSQIKQVNETTWKNNTASWELIGVENSGVKLETFKRTPSSKEIDEWFGSTEQSVDSLRGAREIFTEDLSPKQTTLRRTFPSTRSFKPCFDNLRQQRLYTDSGERTKTKTKNK